MKDIITIEQKNILVKGYGDFLRTITLSKETKLFEVNYPVAKITEDITQTQKETASSFEEAVNIFEAQVEIFEALTQKYDLLIKYNLEEVGSYLDGSGTGFVFNWAIVRRYTAGKSLKYHVMSSFGKKQPSVHFQDLHKWSEMAWTPEREAFFTNLSESVRSSFIQLKKFVDLTEAHDSQAPSAEAILDFTNSDKKLAPKQLPSILL